MAAGGGAEDEEEPEEPDEFDFVPVEEEPEEPAPLGRRGVIGPEDYVVDFDAVAVVVVERSVHEEEERRHHAEEFEALEWRQAVADNVAANEKAEECVASARSRRRNTSTCAAPARRIERPAPPRRRPFAATSPLSDPTPLLLV